MSNTEVILATAKHKKQEKNKSVKVRGSPSGIITGAIVGTCVVVAFLFSSNLMFNDDQLQFVGYNTSGVFTRRVSSSFSPEVGQYTNDPLAGGASGNIAGKGTGKSQFKEFDVYTYDEDLYKDFASGDLHTGIIRELNRTVSDTGAKALSAVFISIKQMYNYNCAIGVITNILRESSGEPGILQDGHHPPGWPDGGRIIKTQAHINSVRACGRDGNKTGFGLCQWTYWTYCLEYAPILEMYLPKSGTMSDDDIRAADLHYLLSDVMPKKAAPVMDTSSPEQASYTMSVNYERMADGSEHAIRRKLAVWLGQAMQKYNK